MRDEQEDEEIDDTGHTIQHADGARRHFDPADGNSGSTRHEYDYTDKGRIRLDRKTDIMDKYGFSPDMADALAYTWAYPVADFSEMSCDLEPQTYAD